ncbi:hypothetical protein KQI63_07310 [bacterium]|nr:hypothetical protein [bacterium]
MKAILAMARLDLKTVSRDSTLIILSLAPVLIAMLIRFGLPALLHFLPDEFVLADHAPFILSVLLLFPPMLLSMIAGYTLLDDRDANLLLYLDVTPLRRTGYLSFRMIAPVLLSFLYGFLMSYGTGLYTPPMGKMFLMHLMAGMEAPVGLLLMAGLAGNKVEGLAVGKFLSLMSVAPFAVYFLPGFWAYSGLLLPQGWVSYSMLADGTTSFLLRWTGGIIVHLIWIGVTYRWFLKRIG